LQLAISVGVAELVTLLAESDLSDFFELRQGPLVLRPVGWPAGTRASTDTSHADGPPSAVVVHLLFIPGVESR